MLRHELLFGGAMINLGLEWLPRYKLCITINFGCSNVYIKLISLWNFSIDPKLPEAVCFYH